MGMLAQLSRDADMPQPRSAWLAELHPVWCANEYANGCGDHFSDHVEVPADADPAPPNGPGGGYLHLCASAVLTEDGGTAVEVVLEGCPAARFTPATMRAFAAGLVKLADLAEHPGPLTIRPAPVDAAVR